MRLFSILTVLALWAAHALAVPFPETPEELSKPYFTPIGWPDHSKVMFEEGKTIFDELKKSPNWPKGKPTPKEVTNFLHKFGLSLKPHQLNFAVGYALRQEGKTELARAQMEQAVKADPSYFPAWCALSLMASEASPTGDVEVFGRAIKAAPEIPGLHNEYARALAKQANDLTGAIEHYERAIAAINPVPDEFYFNQAALLYVDKSITEKKALLTRNAEILYQREKNPRNTAIYATALYLDGKFSEALEIFHPLLEKHPNYVIALFCAADSAYLLEEKETARAYGAKLMLLLDDSNEAKRIKKRLSMY